ncbi:MAG: xylulose kinase [Leptospiraceae bacterium]|nr:FGGY-family carbohydrate kinase [Leptospiraceae bacterium]MCP5496052.1 xylulose kinase [Leptospiraceae bacterium]
MLNNDKYILTIDLGTSGPKAAIISIYGEVVDYEFEPNQVFLLEGGGAEQNPTEWWEAVLKILKKLLLRQSNYSDKIVALSCTAQWSGTVAVDKEGNHLHNAIIWLDSRGSQYANEATDGFPKVSGYGLWKLQKWLRITGGIPSKSGKDSIAHILYIKHQLPNVYRNTYKFLEPKDFLNLKLTGQFAASTDSVTLYWLTDNRDISNIRYNDDLIKMSGIDKEKLPVLKSSIDIIGNIKPEIASQLGLSNEIKVVAGSADIHSASVGSGAVRDYEGHFYIGTSSWMICHVPYKKTDILHNMASLPSAIPGKYFVVTEQETSGACLNFLKNNILYHKDVLQTQENVRDIYKLFDKIVQDVPSGSNKVIFTPWLFGERTPVEDHTVRAAFYNLSLDTTRGHLLRAVFEGVAFNARWLLIYLEKFIKQKFPYLHLIGGGGNSKVWSQILADVLDRPIKQVKDPIQANLKGAAYIASVGLGYMKFEDIPRHIQFSENYTPNPANRKIYDELFREFINIYKSNKDIYRRLNKID